MTRRIGPVLAVAAGLALGLPACTSAQVATQNAHANGGGSQASGPVSVRNGSGGPSGPGASGSAQRSVSTRFSLGFARCMRAHGVQAFPDPGGQFPGATDPASAAFQAALNGPCRPLAPAAWVSTGQVSGGA